MNIPQQFISDLASQKNMVMKDLDKWMVEELDDYILGEDDLTDPYAEGLEGTEVWIKMRDMQGDMILELKDKIIELFDNKPLDER